MLLWNWILSFQLLIHSALHTGLIESTTNVWHKSDGFNNERKKNIWWLVGKGKTIQLLLQAQTAGPKCQTHSSPLIHQHQTGRMKTWEPESAVPKNHFHCHPFKRFHGCFLKITFRSQNVEFTMRLPRRRKILLVASHPHQDEPNAMPSFNFT